MQFGSKPRTMPYMAKNGEMPTHAKKVFQGIIFSVWQWEQKLYDGSVATFEALKRPDTVNVIGVLPDKRIMLVWDEQPHRQGVITPAGGRIEEGETPEVAGRREMLEETGYKAGGMKLWYEYNPSSKADWSVFMYIAKDLRKVGEAHLEAGERIKPRTYTFDEFLQLGSNPDFRDTECRMRLLEARLDEKKRQELYTLLYG